VLSVEFAERGQSLRWSYPFVAQPAQRMMFSHQPDEMLYGGAAGGGKTDALLALGVTACLAVPGFKVLLVRRNYPQIEQEVLPRLLERVPARIARYHAGQRTFTFGNGSVFRLGHLSTTNARYRYQGVEYHMLLWDELTEFTRDEYMFLGSRLRVVGRVAEEMASRGFRPRVVSTSNPGGIGHGWVKQRFVDPGPPRTFQPGRDTEDEPDGNSVMYVPARLEDNQYVDLDQYERVLRRLDPSMRRALREGDWDVLQGARFGQWRRAVHVVAPFVVPLVGHPRAVGVDYGGTAPFAALWGVLLGDGLIYVYREVYRSGLTPRQQASLMRSSELPGEREAGRPIPVALDPSTWNRSATDPAVKVMGNVPPPGSIARAYYEAFGGSVVPARNARVAGWATLDELLAVREDGLPRLVVSEQCVNLIRTLPALLRSAQNPDDVSQSPKQEDHAADALRYLVMQLVLGGDRRTAPDTRRDPLLPGPLTSGLRT